MRAEVDWDGRGDLAAEVLQVVQDESLLRVGFLEMQHQLERATQRAVRVLLRTRHYSVRDAGLLLGITGQRVEQISKEIQFDAFEKSRSNES